MNEEQNAEQAGQNQGTPAGSQNPETLNSPTQVESAGNAPEANGDGGKPFDIQKFFVNNKRVTDGLRQELREVKELLTQRVQQSSPQPPPSAPSSQPDIWTQPDAYVDQRVQRAIDSIVGPQLAQQNLAGRQEKAKELILSQDYIDPDSQEVKDELDGIYKRYGLEATWNINPELAAANLLELYKHQKGIGTRRGPSPSQAGTVPGSSAPASNGNGKKYWTSKEIRAMSSEEYEKNRAAIETAAQEGRIEGVKV